MSEMSKMKKELLRVKVQRRDNQELIEDAVLDLREALVGVEYHRVKGSTNDVLTHERSRSRTTSTHSGVRHFRYRSDGSDEDENPERRSLEQLQDVVKAVCDVIQMQKSHFQYQQNEH